MLFFVETWDQRLADGFDGPRMWKNPEILDSLEQESVKALFQKCLDEKLETTNNLNNTEDRYEYIKNACSAKETIRKPDEDSRRSHPY